jgi:NAD(P)-dependent dehydrogenase (short-subunit alcohol dehydrogenase family)
LPLLREAASKEGARRGRVVFIGTGGGVMSPSPALLSAYMGSKWAGEAFIRVLRLEMALQGLRIDACMLNPGVVKPTALQDGGMAIMEKMWGEMPTAAKPEYKWLAEAFIDYNNNEPGTHKREVAYMMENILKVGRPTMNYKVGHDSKAAPIAGCLPWKVQEWLVKLSMFKVNKWTPN